ncbi:vitamin K epoxide reductase family protein [Trueperella pecoris]|uniref:Vitamin K epoxide reductase family protein n=1 Tax=Trueperella pecoris TaxID=2733571 RepID=A0A7M1QZE0_9ACTO|nr:vitamin K epoxide reductase family protein [Trueperella pecoris]QOR46834.1 vitamin K epoxide reductase family protein [Trueperella pecoris]
MYKEEDLDIAELDRRIAKFEARASEHERAGGASRETALVILISAAVGMLASAMLILSELSYLKNPAGHLICDINPLFGCSTWFTAWQGHLLVGTPNALWGALFFAGMTALGLVLALGGRLPRLLWQGALAGSSLGIAWVVWFAYESFAVEGSLCPYCLLVWLSTIPLFLTLLGRVAQAGHLGQSAEAFGSAMVRNRWVILGGTYFALVLFAVVWFWDAWALVF